MVQRYFRISVFLPVFQLLPQFQCFASTLFPDNKRSPSNFMESESPDRQPIIYPELQSSAESRPIIFKAFLMTVPRILQEPKPSANVCNGRETIFGYFSHLTSL